MSGEVSESLGILSAVEAISDLDTTCSKLESNGRRIPQLAKGPFGVFSAHGCDTDQNFPSSLTSTSQLDGDSNIFEHNIYDDLDQSGEVDPWFKWEVDHNLDDIFNSSEVDPGSNEHSLEVLGEVLPTNIFSPTTFFDTVLADSDQLLSDNLVSSENDQTITRGINSDQTTLAEAELSRTDNIEVLGAPLHYPDLVQADKHVLPCHSEPLLRHYKEVIHNGTPSRSADESPWRVIFLPCALETFAELSLWHSTSHRRLAILHGLLALSAFRLHHKGDSDFRGQSWREIALCYQTTAQDHLRTALKFEAAGPALPKYKELLTAILAISLTSVSRSPPVTHGSR